jgi:hypothetical protein
MHGQVNLLRKCVFPLAGAAVVLLGCQQDPRATAAGGFEPSPVDAQDDDSSMSGRNTGAPEGRVSPGGLPRR